MAADGQKPALISVRQTAEDSKWLGKVDPKTERPIAVGDQVVLCPKCYTPQLLSSWRENDNKCALDGTPANVLERVPRRAAEGETAAAAPAAAAAAPQAAASPAAPAGDVSASGEAAQPAAASAAAPATRAAAAQTQTTATPARPAAAAAATAAPNGAAAAAPPRAAPPARPAAATPVSRTAQRSAARRSQVQLTTWPHLLVPEMMASILLMIGLTVMAWFVNAPLEEHSNPNRTPNPSKAPWYFLNLQELLVHMHPALAGVIVPTLAIILLMVIPYLDVTSDETGVWFSGARGKRVFWISAIYTTITSIGLILIDKFIGIRRTIEGLIPILQTSWISEIVTQTLVPTMIMWIVAMVLYLLIAPYRPTVREVMIAYFTAFAVAWVLLAIVGTAFRGQGLELFWPWDAGMQRIG
ncbi:MAG TPA: hypothetical protein VH257_08325 [Chloroflexota bacterium]|nr:hypothetical protein [Chloroflexota bacterium]